MVNFILLSFLHLLRYSFSIFYSFYLNQAGIRKYTNQVERCLNPKASLVFHWNNITNINSTTVHVELSFASASFATQLN